MTEVNTNVSNLTHVSYICLFCCLGGSSVREVDLQDNNALHLAVWSSHLSMIEYLVKEVPLDTQRECERDRDRESVIERQRQRQREQRDRDKDAERERDMERQKPKTQRHNETNRHRKTYADKEARRLDTSIQKKIAQETDCRLFSSLSLSLLRLVLT